MSKCEHEFQTTSAVMGQQCWKCEIEYTKYLQHQLTATQQAYDALREKLKGIQYEELTKVCPVCKGVNPNDIHCFHGHMYMSGHDDTCWIYQAIKENSND